MADRLLSLSGIGKDYGAERALDGVDLDVIQGESLAIVGRSGSGKSTLLNVVGLLDRPDRGSYWLIGEDITDASAAEWSALRAYYFGFVFQAFHLVQHRDVLENIALGSLYQGQPRRRREAGARELANLFGLDHRLHALPATLSGGERQRVAIARALMGDPKLLLCDEPTGNLDTANAGIVMSALVDLNSRGVTTIIVTHDRDIAAQANTRIELADGRVSSVVRG